MDRKFRILIGIILILFLLSGGLDVISKGQVSVVPERFITNNSETADYSGWNVYLNEDTETPHRVLGKNINIYPKGSLKMTLEKNDIETLTSDFISRNKDFLKVNTSDLKLIKAEYGQGNWYVNYQQHYKDIPVHGAFVGLTMTDDGNVVLLGSDFHMDINISTIPDISENFAIEGAKTMVNFNNGTDMVYDASLTILPIETANGFEYRLTWEVKLSSRDPLGDWAFFIDAQDGSLLHKYNAMKQATINGTITGMIYPQGPSQDPIEVNFSHETVYTDVIYEVKNVFHSENNWYGDHFMKTSDAINLTGASSANLTFLLWYDIDYGTDFLYVEVSNDSGTTWNQLNCSHMTTYYYPQPGVDIAPGHIKDKPAYTGKSNEWIKEVINLDNYLGENILFQFRDSNDIYDNIGVYIDNISVKTDAGIVFSDEGDNGWSKWNKSEFNIVNVSFNVSNITNLPGYYEIAGLPEATSIKVISELKGPYVKVINEDQPNAKHEHTLTAPGTYAWNWGIYDTSDRNEESNMFYHVNKIHDWFKNNFNFTDMDYPINAIVEYDENLCTAYYFQYSGEIKFGSGSGSCNNLALDSDLIYHEYTHGVVHHVYNISDAGQQNAMDEAFADYFAGTINNDSVIAEEAFGSGSKNINNDCRYPDDIQNEPHKDGRILSGSLWEARKVLGPEITDSLAFEAIRTTPYAYNFSEYLDNVLISDDDNANLSDGTPHKTHICRAFGKHGITSDQCLCFPSVTNYPIENSGGVIISTLDCFHQQTLLGKLYADIGVDAIIKWSTPCNSSKMEIRYCTPGFECDPATYSCEYSTSSKSGSAGSYNDTITINESGIWEFFIYSSVNGGDYYSEIYSIYVLPELGVKSINFYPRIPDQGEPTTIITTIKNAESINLNELGQVNVSLLIDNEYVNSKIVNLINVSEKEVNFSWVGDFPDGAREIKIKVDPNNEIVELDKSNNQEAVVISAGCISPGDIYGDAVICPGTYEGETITISADNVTLDCKGAVLHGAGSGTGIYIDHHNNIVIKNCNIINYGTGIYLDVATYIEIFNNTLYSNDYGIYLKSSWTQNKIFNNTLSLNDYGIYLYYARAEINNNTLCGNIQYDIALGSLGYGSGKNNTCNETSGWSDDGKTGCTSKCTGSIIDCTEDSGCSFGESCNTLYKCQTIFGSCTSDDDCLENQFCNLSNHCEFLKCGCVSCSDCEERLNNPTCGIVYLNSNVSSNSSCLYSPQNFTNKIFDCRGYSITGSGLYLGIHLYDKIHTVIRNCFITGFDQGISLYLSSKNEIINNSVNSNNLGIYLYSSTNNNIINNTVNSNNEYGIQLSTSSGNNNLINNTANNNQKHGLYVYSSSAGNTIKSNTLCSNNQSGGNYYDIYDADNTIGVNNTCDVTYNYDDKKEIGCTNICNSSIPKCSTDDDCGAGEFCDYATHTCKILFNCYCNNCTDCKEKLNDNSCNNVKLAADIFNQSGTCINNPDFNNKIFDCQRHIIDGNDTWQTYGIYADGRVNFRIKNCILTDWDSGVYLKSSSYGNVINNTAYSNTDHGIELYLSTNNNLIKNTVNYNGMRGILLYRSSQNTVTGNIANYNEYNGIYSFYYSTDNIITNNTANNNSKGIYVYWDADNNIIINNTANNNDEQGIYLYDSGGITLINNTANSNGDGIFLWSSSNNNMINNTANNNQRHGLYVHSSSTSNIINSNAFCNNNQSAAGNYYDIYDEDNTVGANNTCNTTYNYDDPGKTGCTNKCTEEKEQSFNECDLNQDGIYIHDYNDLGTAYECFMGMNKNKNCDTIKYQDWVEAKNKYECFVRD